MKSDNLGSSDDEENIPIRQISRKYPNININSLKLKIDKILQMVSGDFAASIDKVLELIEKLKQQLKDKDNKCAECSKLLNDVEAELHNSKNELDNTKNELHNSKLEFANIPPPTPPTKNKDDETANDFNSFFDNLKDTNEKQLKDIGQQKSVNLLGRNVQDFGNTIPKLLNFERKKYEENKDLENKDVETQNIALQENEKEYQEILDDINKTVEELTRDYKLTTKENDDLIANKEELVKNLNIKKMIKDTKTRITNILTELNKIYRAPNFGRVTNINIIYFKKLKCLLEELQNYYTSYYIDNADKAFLYNSNNKIKENISIILNFYKQNFKISDRNSKQYTDIDIVFTTNITKINITSYKDIINYIENFNKYLDDAITKVTKKINKTRQNINEMKQAIKSKTIQSRQTQKTGGSHSKRNKTNKFKMRKSKKVKGKRLKKQPATKRRKNRSKKH